MKQYEAPSLPSAADVVDLVPHDRAKNALLPDSIVVCINRGTEVLHGQHNGIIYEIPAGYFRCKYATAKHFKGRFIVPGTRHPENYDRAQSFIAICGLDPDAACVPFTRDELEAMGERVEGLDREQMVEPSRRRTKAVSMKSAEGRGAASRGAAPLIQGDVQGTEAAAARAAEAFTPPAETDAEREARERAGDRDAPKGKGKR